jgi:hypothetical protein
VTTHQGDALDAANVHLPEIAADDAAGPRMDEQKNKARGVLGSRPIADRRARPEIAALL